MNEKSDKKSSIKVAGDQLLGLEQKLRVEDALQRIREKAVRMMTSDDLGGIATLKLFKELRILGDEVTCGFVLCNLYDPDEQGLSLPGKGLLPRFKVSSRQDKFHKAMYRARKPKKKLFSK
ncbi:MAG TPA: hypothetical protein VF141_19250 [Chryseolinea sp.]